MTAAERYAVEAGAYLAYKPGKSNKELGVQVVSMIPDATNLEGYTTADAATDFTPDAAGLYVFRRSIGVDPETKIETFKYDGYYFDGQDYYKVSNLNVVPDGISYAGDDVTTDGNLTSATAGFYEEETKTVTPTLTYDATNKRLVASYVTVPSGNIQSFSSAYNKALQNFEFASEKYKAALRDDGAADADVVGKNAALQKKIDALLAAEKTQKEKADALAAAQTAKDKADAAAQAAETAVTNAQDAKDTADAALATATTNKGTAQSEFNTAQSNLNYLINNQLVAAQTAFNNYKEQNPDVETWFRNYVKNKNSFTNEEEIDNFLANASYQDIIDLGKPTGTDKYRYYSLLAALKNVESAIKRDTLALAGKQDALDLATQVYNDADAAADTAATNLQNAQTAKEQADAAAQAAATNLQNARTAKEQADAAVTAAQGEVDTARAAYNGAVTDAGTTSGTVAIAEADYLAKQKALAEAEAKYNKAVIAYEGTSEIKININLADVVTTTGTADMWQLLPTPNGNDTTAYFYYTSILGAGQTSAQLIDSVELDSSVTDDMFKRFDFDLNVALKSAQITYDADGEITTDATNELDANATLVTPTSVDSVVNWTLK